VNGLPPMDRLRLGMRLATLVECGASVKEAARIVGVPTSTASARLADIDWLLGRGPQPEPVGPDAEFRDVWHQRDGDVGLVARDLAITRIECLRTARRLGLRVFSSATAPLGG